MTIVYRVAQEAVLKHAMTVDVEDYFHVSALSEVIRPADWDQWPSRVELSTGKLLDLFAEKNITATFFVLGCVAQKYPGLIKEIAARGHEVASHGYSHQLVYQQTPDEFKAETIRSKTILEEIVQSPIVGYRAASYSITQKSAWAVDILCELGFAWDSSIFPVHHDRYGVPNSPTKPYVLQSEKGQEIKEFPLTVAKVGTLNVPAAGGGYFRQYPYFLSKYLFNKASQNGARPQMFYLHPWEVDPEQPRVDGLSWKSKFRHYTNLDKCYTRLQRLIEDFEFTTVSDAMAGVELGEPFQLVGRSE